MSHACRTSFSLAAALAAVVTTSGGRAQVAFAQASAALDSAAKQRSGAEAGVLPINNAPNPYRTIENYFKLPAGRTWGSTCAVEIDKDGTTVWVGGPSGAKSGLDCNLDPLVNLDARV